MRDLLKAEFAAEQGEGRGIRQQRKSFVCLLLPYSQLEFHLFSPWYEIALIVGSDYIVKGRDWETRQKKLDIRERQMDRRRGRLRDIGGKYSGEGTQ